MKNLTASIIILTAISCSSSVKLPPNINGMETEELTDGQSYTMSGENFGEKSPVEPYKYNDFEEGAGNIGDTIDPDVGGPEWDMFSSCTVEAISLPDLATRYSNAVTRFAGDIAGWQNFGYDVEHDCYHGTNYLRLWNNDEGFRKIYYSFWIYSSLEDGGYADIDNLKIANYGRHPEPFPQGRWDISPMEGPESGHMPVYDCDGGDVVSNNWHIGYDAFALGYETWNRFEGYYTEGDAGTANGGYTIWKNQKVIGSTGDILLKVNSTCLSANWFAFPHYISRTVPEISPTVDYYSSEIYFDITQARIEICDVATWAQREEAHCEIQIPKETWNDTTVKFTANKGSFTAGEQLYLFVINPYGNVNGEGMGVKFN